MRKQKRKKKWALKKNLVHRVTCKTIYLSIPKET